MTPPLSDLRVQVEQRAGGRCEYCRMHSSLQGATFHLEHVVPQSCGGKTELANLAWACPSCNLHKSDRLEVPDGEDPICREFAIPTNPVREHAVHRYSSAPRSRKRPHRSVWPTIIVTPKPTHHTASAEILTDRRRQLPASLMFRVRMTFLTLRGECLSFLPGLRDPPHGIKIARTRMQYKVLPRRSLMPLGLSTRIGRGDPRGG